MDTEDLQSLIDVAVLRVHELAAETGYLPALNDPRVGEAIASLVWSESAVDGWTSRSMRSVPDELLAEPLEDSATRVVVAAWLFEHAKATVEDGQIAGYMDEATGESERDYFEDHRDDIIDMSLRPLRKFLDLRPAEGLSPDSRLWELHAGGVAQHPNRVIALCDLMVATEDTPQCLAVCSRAAFLAISRFQVGPTLADVLPAWTGPTALNHWDLIVAAVAAISPDHELEYRLRRLGPFDSWRTDAEPAMKIRHWLDRLALKRGLDEVEQLIVAWCGFVAARNGNPEQALAAALSYRAAADHDTWGTANTLLGAAASCFLIAGRADLAEEPIEKRLERAEHKEAAALHLALCFHLQNKEHQTLDAFERYVRLKDGVGEPADFAASLALRFGLLARERARDWDKIATAAMASPTRAQGEALARWMEPFYVDLSDEARRRWWTSLHTLSLPDNSWLLGDDLWTQVAENFAEAVNMELKRRVIRPFIKANEKVVQEEARRQDCPAERRRALNAQGSLGQNLLLLKASAYPANSVENVLYDDLERRNPALGGFLGQTNNRKRLDRLVELRNKAAHDAVTEVEARETYQLAREIMGVVVKRS